ncbi:MAG: PQQ-dependent sugar dehydrogenase, partial [Alphaproteobacteria bacterium]
MRRTLAMALSALAWAGAAIGQPADDRPGQRFQIRPDSLPRPFATPSASNPPDYEEQPLDAPFHVPDGFRVNSFAAQLPHARWLAVAPDGAVFVALSAAGEVVLLRDLDADGTAEARATFAAGFRRPHGLALMGAHLYV